MEPIAEALRDSGIPHAAILGNHDAEGLVTREHVIRWHAGVPGSRTQLPPAGGMPDLGNYRLDVAAERGNGPALRLWMLDSMNRGCGGVPGWCGPAVEVTSRTPHAGARQITRALCRGCVTPQTVAWLKGQLPRLAPAAEAAAFIHIPVPEFIRAWNRGADVRGVKGELTCCPSCNSGAFAVLRCAAVIDNSGCIVASVTLRTQHSPSAPDLCV